MFGRIKIEIHNDFHSNYGFYLCRNFSIIDRKWGFKSASEAAKAGVEAKQDFILAEKIAKGEL